MRISFSLFVLLSLCNCIVMAENAKPTAPISSSIKSSTQAESEQSDWGEALTYFSGPTFGSREGLWAVATIKPGLEIHPPHQHEAEEFMMVLEGTGTWHLNGEEFPAHPGDTLYAEPWHIHGIKNTGTKPLKFVVWKWDTKGLSTPKQD